MKYLKTFELYEVLSKSIGDPTKLTDPDLKDIHGFISQQIAASPIAFKMEVNNYINETIVLTGPFALVMYITAKKDEAPGSKSYNRQYVKSGVSVSIGKDNIEAPNAKELIKLLKKSVSYKQFMKGANIEQLRKAKMKELLSKEFTEIGLIDVIYYTEPQTIASKEDNSGPHASSGTSIHTYTFDLSAAIQAWGEDKVNAQTITKLRESILKRRGYESGYLTSVKIHEYTYTDNKLSITVQQTTYYN